jgi:GNAT superfamily N-acetyltransferase
MADQLMLQDGAGRRVGIALVDRAGEPSPRALLATDTDVAPSDMADAVVRQLRQHRLSTRQRALADALVERGAELVRASWLMVMALPAEVDTGETDIRPLRDAPDEYGELVWRAYPPEHPDHDMLEATPADAAGTIRGYLDGRIVGPLLRAASCEAWSDDRLAGMCVISRMPADDEYEGSPWVTDVCVVPDVQGQGLGRAMLAHSIRTLSDAGETSLGLAVTQGSPARRLYDALGFVERFPAWTLNLR